ncbi:MAG: hypothetical protein AVDCRST_MAG04-165, partial [uncultured Acetobacteraceae bacterium]
WCRARSTSTRRGAKLRGRCSGRWPPERATPRTRMVYVRLRTHQRPLGASARRTPRNRAPMPTRTTGQVGVPRRG